MDISGSEDPIALFQNWFQDAIKTEPNDPEAMALATVDADGQPSVRMVLLKGIEPDGFVFYTNTESRKGRALAANPKAALCLHWKSQRRQVRIEGRVEKVDAGLSDAYFSTRHPLSRLGAWASRQSQPLSGRAELEGRVAAFEKEFSGREIPRPPHWGGYRVVPSKIEFWQEGKGRLHDRFLFTKTDDGWNLTRLNP
jgi:pyridoxamine 5'-phosphate oxidase